MKATLNSDRLWAIVLTAIIGTVLITVVASTIFYLAYGEPDCTEAIEKIKQKMSVSNPGWFIAGLAHGQHFIEQDCSAASSVIKDKMEILFPLEKWSDPESENYIDPEIIKDINSGLRYSLYSLEENQ